MSTTKQTVGKCAITRKAVFVSVTKVLSGKIKKISLGSPLCDLARGFWNVDNNKINQCELLVAVEKGIIRGIWEIDRSCGWKSMTINAIPAHKTTPSEVDPDRKYCKVKNAVLFDLVGKKLSSIGGNIRMYGPIRYNF